MAGSVAVFPQPRAQAKAITIVLGRLEPTLVALTASCISLALGATLYIHNIHNQLADGSFAAQILYNFKSQLWMSSSLVSSILEAMKTLWYKPADFVCSQPLAFQLPTAPLTFHFYLIGYLLIPAARLLSPDIIIAGLQALIYASVPVFAYVLARSLNISIVNSLLMTVLVLQHPLWLDGIFGQFYFNRLFIPFCAGLLWLLTRPRLTPVPICIVALLAASTTEIYGLVLGALLLGIGLFRPHERKFLVVLALCCAGISMIEIKLIQILGGSSSTQDGVLASTLTTNFSGFVQDRLHSLFTPATAAFVVVNVVCLGVPALASPRHLLLATVIVAPNLLVSVGGAEKNGWSTHYHVSYWVPLIWAAIVGASQLHKKNRLLLAGVLTTCIGGSLLLNPATGGLQRAITFAPLAFGSKAATYMATARTDLAYRAALQAAFKPGDSISAPEPALYNLVDHPLYYYPINVDQVNRVVFLYDQSQSGLARFHTVNYGQQDPQLDSCIVSRMQGDGFDFGDPQMVGPWAIVGRD